MYKTYKIGSFTTSEIEIKDLLKSWIAISLAFAFLLRSSFPSQTFSFVMAVSFFTVGIGFIFHEIGHKIVAQNYGCYAEFRSNDRMLILAVILAYFLGFVFAAPGAVMISGPVGIRRNGKISAAGPIMNIILAFIFLLLYFSFSPSGVLAIVLKVGVMVNSFIGLFNLIPIMPFDGAKIVKWNKLIYAGLIVLSIIFLLSSYSI